MSAASKHKIDQDNDYKAVVKAFSERRKNAAISKRDMATASDTGIGRISQFESLKHNPTLLTFTKWCRTLGLKIQLVKSGSAPTARPRQLKKIIAERSDTGRIIDQIKSEKKTESF